MQRTKLLRLQKPDAGDTYNSNTLTQNVDAIDKYMGNLGGNVPYRKITDMSQVLKMRTDDFTMDGGGLTLYGNGMAYLEVNFTNKKALTVNSLGMFSGHPVVADVYPEFATAIAQPMTSGGVGIAVGGYIAPNTTRVVLRLLKGFTATTINIGNTLQLSGFYPLENVPKSIGLEQMNPKSFDSEVHTRNLIKIDSVASKVKTKLPALSYTDSDITMASGFTRSNLTLHRNSNGTVTFYMTFTRNTAVIGNVSGDIGNITVATINKVDVRPDVWVKCVSTATGPMLHGEVNPSGNIIITSNAGKNSSIAAGSAMQLAGDWPYRGN